MTRELAVSPLRRPLAVTLYFACHAVAALVFALPTTAVVAGTGLGRFPEGDRLLFQPGGVVAAEVVRTLMPALPAQVLSSLSVAALLGMLLLVPHAALLVGLARTEREPLSATWGRAIGHLPPLLALSGFALLAQALVLVATLTFAGALRGAWLGRDHAQRRFRVPRRRALRLAPRTRGRLGPRSRPRGNRSRRARFEVGAFLGRFAPSPERQAAWSPAGSYRRSPVPRSLRWPQH